jgi:cohesin complex subunit SA-1/2
MLTRLKADVFTSGQESEEAVAGFLNRYKENGPGAVAELVNFVLKSAGCDLTVTEDDINDTDNINGRIADLQEEYQAVGVMSFGSDQFKKLTSCCSKTFRIIL